MSYTAQELNTNIGLERFESYRDSDGILHEEWVTYGEAFAKVEPLVGREFLAAEATQSQVTTKFTMRHRGDIDTTMRIQFDGKTFDIQSIQNIRSGNRETLIYAKAAT